MGGGIPDTRCTATGRTGGHCVGLIGAAGLAGVLVRRWARGLVHGWCYSPERQQDHV